MEKGEMSGISDMQAAPSLDAAAPLHMPNDSTSS